MKRDSVYALGATVVVVTTLAFAFFKLGSPATQRQFESDRTRVQSLDRITTAVETYWNLHQKAPATIAEAAPYLSLKDPQSGKPYEYIPGPGRTFKVCAVFVTDARADGNEQDVFSSPHPAGHYCFEKAAPAPLTTNQAPATIPVPPPTIRPSSPPIQ